MTDSFATQKNNFARMIGSDGRESSAGFAKGTSVYTKEGIKPIEDIRAGDWVLSSPRGTGDGEKQYKRVIQALAHEQQRVFKVIVQPEGWKFPDRLFSVNASSAQAFWVVDKGWVQIEQLKAEFTLRQIDASRPCVGNVKSIYRTSAEGVGWVPTGRSISDRGSGFDYANFAPTKDAAPEYLPKEIINSSTPYLKLPVFGLIVEDFHTFYAGKAGYWVRDSIYESTIVS